MKIVQWEQNISLNSNTFTEVFSHTTSTLRWNGVMFKVDKPVIIKITANDEEIVNIDLDLLANNSKLNSNEFSPKWIYEYALNCWAIDLTNNPMLVSSLLIEMKTAPSVSNVKCVLGITSFRDR